MYIRKSTTSTTTFHRAQDCQQLTKKPARGNPQPTEAIDLAQVLYPRPCKTCYPDAPRPKAVRRFCPACNKSRARPCEHNGGVRVTVAFPTSYVSLLRDPGEEVIRTIWVWPDQAHFYEPIAS